MQLERIFYQTTMAHTDCEVKREGHWWDSLAHWSCPQKTDVENKG